MSATFSERLQPTFAAMTVVGPDGIGPRPLGPAGTYTVTYRVTSADGHAGSWSFRLTVPGTGTPGSAPPAGRRQPPLWPFAVVAAAFVAAGAIWAVRRRP